MYVDDALDYTKYCNTIVNKTRNRIGQEETYIITSCLEISCVVQSSIFRFDGASSAQPVGARYASSQGATRFNEIPFASTSQHTSF
jgi:hypothetical protein